MHILLRLFFIFHIWSFLIYIFIISYYLYLGSLKYIYSITDRATTAPVKCLFVCTAHISIIKSEFTIIPIQYLNNLTISVHRSRPTHVTTTQNIIYIFAMVYPKRFGIYGSSVHSQVACKWYDARALHISHIWEVLILNIIVALIPRFAVGFSWSLCGYIKPTTVCEHIYVIFQFNLNTYTTIIMLGAAEMGWTRFYNAKWLLICSYVVDFGTENVS